MRAVLYRLIGLHSGAKPEGLRGALFIFYYRYYYIIIVTLLWLLFLYYYYDYYYYSLGPYKILIPIENTPCYAPVYTGHALTAHSSPRGGGALLRPLFALASIARARVPQ